MKRTIFGRVTDFDGAPLAEAQIRVQGRNYKRDITSVLTDADGRYRLEVEEGDYLAVWICKGYKENNLEYWVWNVPLYQDLELSARIGKLEIYALDVLSVHRSTKGDFMLYMRPMSLRRHAMTDTEKADGSSVMDIAPPLDPATVRVSIDGVAMHIGAVERIVEKHGEIGLYGYLVSVRAKTSIEPDRYYRFDVEITDKDYGDRGEGSVFWKMKNYMEIR